VTRAPLETYAPVNTIKAVADDLWIVDGPLIRFGFGWLKAPFTTRMTILRLADGDLFIHSPTELTDTLRQDVLSLGTPRWLIAPNRLHYSWIGAWKSAFPGAAAYLAPRVVGQANGGIGFEHAQLAGSERYPWDHGIATLPVSGRYMTEFVFFHHATRTLIVTDLIENFEPSKLHSWALRALTRLGGVQDPNGGMPRDMRLSFSRPNLRAAVETMLAWNPARIILAHGRCYMSEGAAELRRAFDWLLRSGQKP
jgi:hypothetical protein